MSILTAPIKALFFSAILLTAIGCNRKSRHYDKIFTSFPKEKFLQIKKDSLFFVPQHIQPGRIFLGEDFIVIRNDNLQRDSLFHQYSSDGTFQKKYVQHGISRGMAYAAMSSGVINGKVWFHDLALSKIVIVDPKSDDNLKVEYKLKNFAYSTQLLNEKTLLTSGFHHTPYLLESFKLSSGKLEKEIGLFIPSDDKIPFNNWKAAYESFLFLRPEKDKAVLAGRYSDNIEILDLHKETKIAISGPDNFHPIFIPATDSLSNHYKVGFSNKSRVATTGGFVTNKYIYQLYAGVAFLTEDWLGYSDIIQVYDWNGNPVIRLNLDKKIKSIAVSKDDKILYSVEGTTGIVTKTVNFL